MIPRECKRLAEVDFPIAAVGRAVLRREKKFPVPRGHISTLHHWWARRPLGSSRAILLAMLLPDPGDPHCPATFRSGAKQILRGVVNTGSTDSDLRKALLQFLGDFAEWHNSTNPVYLQTARRLVELANNGSIPLVADSFAGGGAIPLEALRLGCDAIAMDVNPVACLLLNLVLAGIPRGGPELVDQLTAASAEVSHEVAGAFAALFPSDHDGAIPAAYLWARTVRCEAPSCGAEIPLIRSFWLSRKGSTRLAVRYQVKRQKPGPPSIDFEVFEPRSEDEVPRGSVRLAKATCLACHTSLLAPRVRDQLRAQHGGARVVFGHDGERIGGARLWGVVTVGPDWNGKRFRAPSDRDYVPVRIATEMLIQLQQESSEVSAIPDEPVSQDGTGSVGGGYRTRKYGITNFGQFFSARQAVAASLLCRAIAKIRQSGRYSSTVSELLALSVDKIIDFNCSLSRWRASNEDIGNAFGRQALPMVWDFAETSLASSTFVDFERARGHIDKVLAFVQDSVERPGEVQLTDARDTGRLEESVDVFFTDPPYYDAVPYADLADFFYVWLKRSLPLHPLLRDPFNVTNQLTPKEQEITRDEVAHLDGRARKDARYYEAGMGQAFLEGRRITNSDGLGCVIFAHKTTEGWEALLTGLIGGGWTISASWPIATEMGSRLRAKESAALATSVHLICRPRGEHAIGDWGQVLRELPKRVSEWMSRLQAEGIRGADLVFACIGPALEVYSRYAKVVDAEDREIPLGGDPAAKDPHQRGYLAYVWEIVGRLALEQVLGAAEAGARQGTAGSLEEDARLTALFLWTIQASVGQESASVDGVDADDNDDDEEEEESASSNAPRRGGFTLIYDVARRFAQPLGIHLETWEGRIIETKKGVVRLLPIRERARILFGEAGADIAADRIESAPAGAAQLDLFAGVEAEAAAPPAIRGRGRGRRRQPAPDESLETRQEATTLDRVHAAMLLQASGRSNALRALLAAEIGRSPDFLRLANALAVLYPKDSEEKRLVEAMLLAAPK